jgi:AMIN domain
MRIMRRGWGLAGLFAASLILTSEAAWANDGPVVHVKAEVKDGSVRLEAQANAPFEYTSYRPSETLYVLDLTGVTAGDSSGARVVSSDLVKSYRLIAYTSGQKPTVRLEVLLSPGVEPRLERKDSKELTLSVTRAANAAATGSGAISSGATLKPASAKTSDAQPSGIESINQVKLLQNAGQTEVNVIGSGHLTYHVSRLQHPDRIVLDFSGSHLKAIGKSIPSNLDPVREIRLAQFAPEVSRIVIDLRQPAR